MTPVRGRLRVWWHPNEAFPPFLLATARLLAMGANIHPPCESPPLQCAQQCGVAQIARRIPERSASGSPTSDHTETPTSLQRLTRAAAFCCAAQDNVNPVEGVERSSLILASAVHRRPAADLIRPEHVPAARARAPALFAAALEGVPGV